MESDHTTNPQREDVSTPTSNRLPPAEFDEAVRAFADREREAVETVPGLSTTKLFELLADPGRRYVLTYVLGSDGFVTVSELVDYVLGRTTSSMTRPEFRERLASELTHTHLPKLAAEGLVQYNVERQVVSRTEATALVGPYLKLALAHERTREEATASR